MTYINSLGFTRMTQQETVDVYRSIAGELPTAVASGIYISHVMPIENTLETEIDYENFKTFEIKQFFTTYSGLRFGDEIHMDDNTIYDIRVVEKWETPTYYHCIVEELR